MKDNEKELEKLINKFATDKDSYSFRVVGASIMSASYQIIDRKSVV